MIYDKHGMKNLFQKRHKLILHKKLFLSLSLYSKEPKQLKKTITELSKKDISGLITFLKYVFGGDLELSKELQFLLKRKNFQALEELYAKGQLSNLYDKAVLASFIVTIAHLLECLY